MAKYIMALDAGTTSKAEGISSFVVQNIIVIISPGLLQRLVILFNPLSQRMKGQITINGKVYELQKNNGENNLHGGNPGYNRRMWKGLIADDNKGLKVHRRSLYASNLAGGNQAVVRRRKGIRIYPHMMLQHVVGLLSLQIKIAVIGQIGRFTRICRVCSFTAGISWRMRPAERTGAYMENGAPYASNLNIFPD